MPNQYSEDYFDGTKMTFGEHLEELRGALWKSLLSLIFGFLIGLWFGFDVVEFIQLPMKDALRDYYQKQSIQELAKILATRDGRDVVSEADIAAAEYAVRNQGLILEKRWVDPVNLFDATRLQMHEMAATELALQSNRQANPEDEITIDDLKEEEIAAAKEQLQNGAGDFLDQWFAERNIRQLLRSVLGATEESWPIPKRQQTGSPRKYKLIPLEIYHDISDDIRVRVISLGAQEGFMTYIKASFVLGAIIASPFVFFFTWQFVAAGLYPHEKKQVYIFGPFSLALFLAGAALAFFVVIRLVLEFLFGFNAAMGIDPDPRIQDWLSFVMLLPLGFGVAFQLPLVMLFLERIGVMSVGSYVDKWRIAVMIIAVLSMVLTPADPGSMIAMGVPLVLLYFFGIGLCKLWPRKASPLED